MAKESNNYIYYSNDCWSLGAEHGEVKSQVIGMQQDAQRLAFPFVQHQLIQPLREGHAKSSRLLARAWKEERGHHSESTLFSVPKDL